MSMSIKHQSPIDREKNEIPAFNHYQIQFLNDNSLGEDIIGFPGTLSISTSHSKTTIKIDTSIVKEIIYIDNENYIPVKLVENTILDIESGETILFSLPDKEYVFGEVQILPGSLISIKHLKPEETVNLSPSPSSDTAAFKN